MSRTNNPSPVREPAVATPTAPAAETSTTTPTPAPATEVPVEAVTSPPRTGGAPVDAPSLPPDRSTLPGDVGRPDDSMQGSLAPEVTADGELDDPFGLDLGVGGPPTSLGDGAIDLPDAPAAAELPRTDRLDVGVDFDNLQGTGSLDGRGVDTFEGGSGATGPADPSAMIGDGVSRLTTEATDGTLLEWVGGALGFPSAAETAFAKADAVAELVETGTEDVEGPSTPGVTVGEDGVASTVTAPKEVPGVLQALADVVMGKKNIDGSQTETARQMEQIDKDYAEPYDPPTEVPPGSAVDASIGQSLRHGLGGDRGGDIDPFDDPQSSPTDGERIYDPYDSVVDPGPDGFTVDPDIDETMLPDAIDVIDPYLAHE